MRRAFVLLIGLFAVAGPAGAATGGVVFTQGSAFIPGDDCALSFQGDCVAPGQPVAVVEGGELSYTNLDVIPHNIVSNRCKGASGDYYNLSCPAGKSRLFSSGSPTTTGSSTVVAGVEDLAEGTYSFFCGVHPAMRGQLTVVAGA